MSKNQIKALSGPRTHICWTPDGKQRKDAVNVVLITEEDFDRANLALMNLEHIQKLATELMIETHRPKIVKPRKKTW